MLEKTKFDTIERRFSEGFDAPCRKQATGPIAGNRTGEGVYL
jgi:hypothetical protein